MSAAASRPTPMARGQPWPYRHMAPAPPMTGPARSATAPQIVAACEAPIARKPLPEDGDEQVVRDDRAQQADESAQRSGRDRPCRGAERERDAEPGPDDVGRDEQAVRPLELVGDPGRDPEAPRRRRSTCRSRRGLAGPPTARSAIGVVSSLGAADPRPLGRRSMVFALISSGGTIVGSNWMLKT